jgi:hypothetical protein
MITGFAWRSWRIDGMFSRLTNWKEIAQYLDKGIRTVQRWEQQMGLPVRRLLHELRRERAQVKKTVHNPQITCHQVNSRRCVLNWRNWSLESSLLESGSGRTDDESPLPNAQLAP